MIYTCNRLLLTFITKLVFDVVSLVVVFFEVAPETNDVLGPEELNFSSLAQIPRRASSSPCCSLKVTLKFLREISLCLLSGIHTSNLVLEHVFQHGDSVINLTIIIKADY